MLLSILFFTFYGVMVEDSPASVPNTRTQQAKIVDIVKRKNKNAECYKLSHWPRSPPWMMLLRNFDPQAGAS